LVDIGLLSVPITSIIIIWNETPTFYDKFYIHAEAKRVGFILLFAVTVYLVFSIFGFVHDTYWILWYFTTVSATTSVFVVCLLTTYWVLSKDKDYLMKVQNEKLSLPMFCQALFSSNFSINDTNSKNDNDNNIHSLVSKSNSPTLTTIPKHAFQKPNISFDFGKTNNPTQLTLETLIASERGFEGFINYLQTEFSMENLLSIVEMTQYQMYIKEIRAKEPRPSAEIPNNLMPTLDRTNTRDNSTTLEINNLENDAKQGYALEDIVDTVDNDNTNNNKSNKNSKNKNKKQKNTENSKYPIEYNTQIFYYH